MCVEFYLKKRYLVKSTLNPVALNLSISAFGIMKQIGFDFFSNQLSIGFSLAHLGIFTFDFVFIIGTIHYFVKKQSFYLKTSFFLENIYLGRSKLKSAGEFVTTSDEKRIDIGDFRTDYRILYSDLVCKKHIFF